MAQKLKIAIFHLGFFFSGGGEKLVIEEALGLTKKGHEVDIFAPVVDKKKCFPDLIRKVNVKSLFFPAPFYFPLWDLVAIAGAVVFTPLFFRKYKKYDCFYGANQPGPLICYFLSKMLNKPYLVYLAQPTRVLYPRKIDSEVGFGKGTFNVFYTLTRIFYPIVKYLDKVSIEKAGLVLVNGEYIAGVIRKIYKVKVVVCPAGTHVADRIIPLPRRKRGSIKISGRLIDKPYILVTNRHYPQKKLEYAIETLAFIRRKFPEMSLIITGAATKYTNELMNLVDRLELKDFVRFVGLVNEEDLNLLYKNALVYLYTSPEEDFGMGIIEAMAAGTPVVAWNKAGPTITVENGITGFWAKSGDSNDYKRKVLRLIADEKLTSSMGLASWKRSNLFSYQIHNEMLNKRLIEMVKSHA